MLWLPMRLSRPDVKRENSLLTTYWSEVDLSLSLSLSLSIPLSEVHGEVASLSLSGHTPRPAEA